MERRTVLKLLAIAPWQVPDFFRSTCTLSIDAAVLMDVDGIPDKVLQAENDSPISYEEIVDSYYGAKSLLERIENQYIVKDGLFSFETKRAQLYFSELQGSYMSHVGFVADAGSDPVHAAFMGMMSDFLIDYSRKARSCSCRAIECAGDYLGKEIAIYKNTAIIAPHKKAEIDDILYKLGMLKEHIDLECK